MCCGALQAAAGGTLHEDAGMTVPVGPAVGAVVEPPASGAVAVSFTVSPHAARATNKKAALFIDPPRCKRRSLASNSPNLPSKHKLVCCGALQRRLAFALLFPLVACGQLWAFLELVGFSLQPPGLVFAAEGACVAGSVAYAWRSAKAAGSRADEPPELARWWLVGVGVFLVWAILYFSAGHVADAPRARTFDDAILARVPIVPAFAGIYLGVHVFGVIPFCVMPEVRYLRRHMLGAILIVVLSSVLWVALPVRVDRPPLDPALPGFGAFLLRAVYSFDPTTNCFPSAHCAIAVYAAIGLRFSSRLLFGWGIVTAFLVCISTVLTHQHYVADVLSGAVLAALCAYGTAIRKRARS